MARNAEPNGMASIGKQMTVGGYAAVEQGGEAPLSPEDLGDITKETPRDSRRLTRRQIITRRFWRNKGAVVGAIGFLLMVLFALLGDAATHWTFTDVDSSAFLQAPSADHWFGTTQGGRDVYAMVVEGTRKSMMIGVFVALLQTWASPPSSGPRPPTSAAGGEDRPVGHRPAPGGSLLPHHRDPLPTGRSRQGLHRAVHHPPGRFRVDAHGPRGALTDPEREEPGVRQCRPLHERVQSRHHRPAHPAQYRLPAHRGRHHQRGLRRHQRDDAVLLRFRGRVAQHLPGHPHRRGAALRDHLPLDLLAPAAVLVLMLLCVNVMGDGLRDAIDPSSKSGGKA